MLGPARRRGTQLAVAGRHHNSGERNGKLLDVDCCIVFELKDGRIVDGSEHFYDLHNWDGFWS